MLLSLVMMAGLAGAEPRLGVGVSVGDPTGLSLGWRGNAWSGAQAGLGYDDGGFDVHADYLQTVTILEPFRRVQVPLYVGAGAGFETGQAGWLGESSEASLRVPVGASLLFDRVPIELFAQGVPTVRVVPDTAFGVDLGLGARWYF